MKKTIVMTLACVIVVFIALGSWFFSDFWKETFSNQPGSEAAYWSARRELRVRLQGSWVGFEKPFPLPARLENDSTAEVDLAGAVIDRTGASVLHHWQLHMKYEAGRWKISAMRDLAAADPAHRAPPYLKTR